MNLRTRFALTTALVGAAVALAAALGGQVVVASQIRHEIDLSLTRRVGRIENPGALPGAAEPRPDHGPARDTALSNGQSRISQTDSAARDTVSPAPGDGTGRRRRRSDTLANVGPDGQALSSAELQTFALNRRCLNGRRGDSVILAQLIAADGTVEQCLPGQRFPVDTTDKALAQKTQSPTGVDPRIRTVSVGGDKYRMATVVGPLGATQWVRELAGESEVLRRLRWQFVLLGLAATLLAALAGWLLAAGFLRPIQKLRSATDRIAETQNLTEPVDTSGQDEIASLGRSFNAMITALSTSREQQQRLIIDASHELRTPLTSLRTNIETANRPRRLSDDDNREVMGAALAEVQELTTVISELVELATDRTADEPIAAVHLVDLANDVAERTRRRTDRVILVNETPSAMGTVVNVGATGHSGTAEVDACMGRPRMLERAIANLVENAVKYSTPGSGITIEVSTGSVLVVDEGPGIDAQDLPHIFDRFYRSDQARAAQGSGLGLAIVHQIVERHGGHVSARNKPGRGAAVGFTLPLVAEAR